MLTYRAFEPISTPPVVTRENIGKMMGYQLCQDDSKRFSSLIQRKAITEYYFLNDKKQEEYCIISCHTQHCKLFQEISRKAQEAMEVTHRILSRES
jgi:predicted lipoprotein with Yx(FWY)xxD motif